ncbi:hypothetical protein ACLK19_07100 [Escherichia coli]
MGKQRAGDQEARREAKRVLTGFSSHQQHEENGSPRLCRWAASAAIGLARDSRDTLAHPRAK